MELIKKIKEAEAQAQEIVEQAKTQAARQAEEARENRLKTQLEAEQERKKAIEASVETAQSDGLAEVEQLKARAEKDRQNLRNKVTDKTSGAVAKVMDYLGSHFAKDHKMGPS